MGNGRAAEYRFLLTAWEYNMVLYAKRDHDHPDHRRSRMSSKPKGRISSWPDANDGSVCTEGWRTGDVVGVSEGVVVSAEGVDDGNDAGLFDRLLKSERKMETKVSF